LWRRATLGRSAVAGQVAEGAMAPAMPRWAPAVRQVRAAAAARRAGEAAHRDRVARRDRVAAAEPGAPADARRTGRREPQG
jgi:hypothetical protein